MKLNVATKRASGWVGGGAVLAGALATGGCGLTAQPVRPLTAEQFAATPVDSRSIGNPVDRPGAVLYDQVHIIRTTPGPIESSETVSGIGKTVRESVVPPGAVARTPTTLPATQVVTAAPTTAPATHPAEPEGWTELGGTLMEVNGSPIFTDTVLRDLERPLAAEAKRRNEGDFRKLAQSLIVQQVKVHERDELEFATADRELGPEDKGLARGLTTQWRQKQITASGGSIEMAKQRAAADGMEFEELVRRQYRLLLVQIFYQKRVIPLIQVSAADIRSYYNSNRDKEFTQHGQARFRVIKIDPNLYKGRKDEAISVASEIVKRAKTEDFAQLASEINDDAGWKAVGGEIGWVNKGAFRFDAVEQAVWTLQPGEVSDVISPKGSDRFYFVAKLEGLKEDKVESFEDLAIQDRIRDRLRKEQFNTLREKHVTSLEKEAVTSRNDGMLQTALAIVMRRYPQWATTP